MMVEPAEQHPVVDVGGAVVDPGDDVVHLGPGCVDLAARDDAAAVTSGDRAALGLAEESFLAAEVEHLTVHSEKDLAVPAGADELIHGAHRHGGFDPVDPADSVLVGEVD
ncbi:hypothetical protein, partial [Cryobacterium sp. TmT2-59]|uniref:hypothetical protein n=1 Tax=Cryobacterium sp. TmT2-59 TaxID=1259264 RepID=UPI0018E07068